VAYTRKQAITIQLVRKKVCQVMTDVRLF